MNRHREIELVQSRTIHSGRAFEVLQETVRLPSGKQLGALVVDQPMGAVAVAARFANGELLLVRQYRHAVGDWLLEIPAGRLDPGETPLEAARRELEEETGYRARRWTQLVELVLAPALCTERMTLFLADQLDPAGPEPGSPWPPKRLPLQHLQLPARRRRGVRGRTGSPWIAPWTHPGRQDPARGQSLPGATRRGSGAGMITSS